MTTLIAWIAYSATSESPELPRAIYVASDSRITWGSRTQRWDSGRKVFNSNEATHLFGYCGDVVFPSIVLSQVVSAIDNDILFTPGSTPDRKHECILEVIKTSFDRRHSAPDRDFSIVHAFRQSSWPDTAFSFWYVEFKAKSKTWLSKKIQLPDRTQRLIELGSGATAVGIHARLWEESDVGGTSRAIFSAFCEALDAEADEFSGGPPQISALYAALPPKPLGVVKSDIPYLHGLEVPRGSNLSNIEWRDELFQRLDPKTMQPFKGARRFVKPPIGT